MHVSIYIDTHKHLLETELLSIQKSLTVGSTLSSMLVDLFCIGFEKK